MAGAAPVQLDASYYADPYSVHARLRALHPVCEVVMPGGEQGWLITQYEDARAALADPRLRKVPAGWRRNPDAPFAALRSHMLNSDPPDHERLRTLVNRAFTPRRAELLRPRIHAIADSLLDTMSAHRDVDFLTAFALPLPITVICELLGVPARDQDQLRAWSATVIDGTGDGDFQTDGMALLAYLEDLLAAKRAQPCDDLLSALIQARDGADRLSENELVSMAFLLIVAGHETTVSLICDGMLELLLNPDELGRLRENPGLAGPAVEEMLRQVSPVNQATYRFAAEPVEIGGVLIPRDGLVLIALSSANRDPARFDAPDRLDIGRDTGGHLAFGHGIHYCVGAPLARLEATIAFDALLHRFPEISLAVPPESLSWRPSSLIHGLEALPVHLFPA